MELKKKYILTYFILFLSIVLMILFIILSALRIGHLSLMITFMILSIIMFGMSLVYLMYLNVKHSYFICPICNKEFKGEAKEIIFGVHGIGESRVTCPHCNKKVWCKEIIKEED